MTCHLARCAAGNIKSFASIRPSQHFIAQVTSSRWTSRTLMAAKAAAGAGQLSAEVVVQKQLEAYNARDLEGFMDLLSDDCVATDAVTGAVLGTGKAELRKRYEARFQTEVHSELLGRLSLGDVVVDREIITGLPNAESADCLATYHCGGGKIRKMSFVWQPRSN